MPRDRSFPLLLACFLFSGLAALIYETAWTREFSFVFGTSDLAVATVLAAYMAGLAAGAALAGRYAARLARPILVYGLLELGIAISALAVPFAIAAARLLYVALFGSQEALPDAGGLATPLFYLACSFLILFVPTALMGATLPLLARYAVREDAQIGTRIGTLYAVNTAGAVGGVVLAGFVLLPEVGLRATIACAAAVNALVFGAAWALARSAPALAPDDAAAAPPASAGSCPRSSRRALPRSPTRCSGCAWSDTWSAAARRRSRPCSRASSPVSRSDRQWLPAWRRTRGAPRSASAWRSSASQPAPLRRSRS